MLRVGVVVHLRQDDSYGDGYVMPNVRVKTPAEAGSVSLG